ncbi:TPA: hypothetical protein ACM6Z1_005883, partial [Raoultella ornithinolytica]
TVAGVPRTVLTLSGDVSGIALDSMTGSAAVIPWNAGVYHPETDMTLFTTDEPVLNEGIISLTLTQRG